MAIDMHAASVPTLGQTTACALLRHAGVDLGKTDFLGPAPKP